MSDVNLKLIPKTTEGLRDALFDEINLVRQGKSNPHRASNFNEYKFECLMEDAKKLVEASEKAMNLIAETHSISIKKAWDTNLANAIEEFKANWEIK